MSPHRWKLLCESVPGVSHEAVGLPCQDHSSGEWIQAGGETVLLLVCADGAGSAQHADVGAKIACEAVAREMRQALLGGLHVADIDSAIMTGLLRSNGIETAYDIQEERILQIGGFKENRTRALLAWKEQVSRQFRFNAAAAVSPGERAAVVVKYRQLQQRLEAQLPAGLAKLRGCSDNAARDLAQLSAKMPLLVSRVAQAQLDAQLLPDALS